MGDSSSLWDLSGRVLDLSQAERGQMERLVILVIAAQTSGIFRIEGLAVLGVGAVGCEPLGVPVLPAGREPLLLLLALTLQCRVRTVISHPAIYFLVTVHLVFPPLPPNYLLPSAQPGSLPLSHARQ